MGRRTILVVGAQGTISDNLVHAIEHEFPGTQVEHVADAVSACAQAAVPVPLILIDVPVLEAVEGLAPLILAAHPRAVFALVDRGIRETTFLPRQISGSRLVGSVLPMNVSLDIWLSLIRLMLSGGNYLPPDMMRGNLPEREPVSGYAWASTGARSRDAELGSLTGREMQILQLVSRGLQNKNIAAVLSLSESTVKIHLHNIIAKLRVHNRTEAAARYRDGMASQVPV